MQFDYFKSITLFIFNLLMDMDAYEYDELHWDINLFFIFITNTMIEILLSLQYIYSFSLPDPHDFHLCSRRCDHECVACPNPKLNLDEKRTSPASLALLGYLDDTILLTALLPLSRTIGYRKSITLIILATIKFIRATLV